MHTDTQTPKPFGRCIWSLDMKKLKARAEPLRGVSFGYKSALSPPCRLDAIPGDGFSYYINDFQNPDFLHECHTCLRS